MSIIWVAGTGLGAGAGFLGPKFVVYRALVVGIQGRNRAGREVRSSRHAWRSKAGVAQRGEGIVIRLVRHFVAGKQCCRQRRRLAWSWGRERNIDGGRRRRRRRAERRGDRSLKLGACGGRRRRPVRGIGEISSLVGAAAYVVEAAVVAATGAEAATKSIAVVAGLSVASVPRAHAFVPCDACVLELGSKIAHSWHILQYCRRITLLAGWRVAVSCLAETQNEACPLSLAPDSLPLLHYQSASLPIMDRPVLIICMLIISSNPARARVFSLLPPSLALFCPFGLS